MGWWTYYAFWMLVPTVLALVSQHPAILGVVVVALVLRRWIPDPVLFFRYAARVNALRGQIAANPHNAVAQRALAMIFLEKRRPARALPLLEQALTRDPDSAELHYLLGTAQLRSGDPQRALVSLGEAIQREERLAYGEPYLRAGDAFLAVGNLASAREAYRRFIEMNQSSLEGRVKLAGVHARSDDAKAARAALEDAVQTYGQIPGFLRRRQLGWYLRARWNLLMA